jgi:uncharacterized delta-60 repeat protein
MKNNPVTAVRALAARKKKPALLAALLLGLTLGVSSLQATTILLLVDINNSLPSPFPPALANLGLSYQLFRDEASLNTAIAGADPQSTLVVVDCTWQSYTLTGVDNFVRAGGRVILQYYDLLYRASLAAALNVSIQTTVYSPPPVYDWGGSPLFSGLSSPLYTTDRQYADGQTLQPVAGGQAVAGFVASLTANRAAIVIGNSGRTICNGLMLEDITSSANAIQLAQKEIAFVITAAPPPIALAEALDAPSLVWTSGGNSPWAGQTNVTHDASDAAGSGALTDGQESWLQTTATGPGTVAFWWKVSSEASCDLLQFYIGGVWQAEISGEVDWQHVAFAVPAGSQTLRWRYVKDIGTNLGQDRGLVDEVSFAPASGAPVILVQPLSREVVAGASPTFAVRAEGGPQLSYQWFSNQTSALAGATSTALTLTNTTLASAGGYSVVVSNDSGSVTSSLATLTIVALGTVDNVLLYVDGSASSPYQSALTSLGRSYQLFMTQSPFEQAIANASVSRTLVIVDSTAYRFYSSHLLDWANAHGRALLQNYNLGLSSSLAAAFDATSLDVYSAPLPLYDWGGSPFFLGLSSPLSLSHRYGVDGQKLDPIVGGQSVAGYVSSPAPSQAAVVIGNSGHTILSGILLETVTSTVDAVRFAQNEIQFLIDQTAPVPPTVTTLAASAITTTGAKLNGTVNPSGATTRAWFDYGLTSSYGSSSAFTNVGAGSSSVAVALPVGALSSGTIYHYRLVATNSVGTTLGGDLTFQTVPVTQPAVTTLPASEISATGAVLNGTVNPSNATTVAWFDYGLTTSYGSSTATANVGSLRNPVAVTLPISSLSPGTIYHYRLVATNSAGRTLGGDLTFQTLTAGPPEAATLQASIITVSGAVLNGTVNPSKATTVAWFDYGLSTNYGSSSATADVGSGSYSVAVAQPIGGLSPGTIYHYRLVATNYVSTTLGGDLTFQTLPVTVPAVTTLAASNITTTEATLNGSANPSNATTVAWFDYGPTASYGSSSAITNVGNGSNSVAVAVSIGLLSPGTTYHYRLVATNCVGATLGGDLTFQTVPLTPPADDFNPGADGLINALALQPDGKILVGGAFVSLAGQPRSRIARLNADGTLDAGFNPGANSDVYALVVQADGRIVVGGAFTSLGGGTRSRIGRLNTDGTQDIGFSPGANSDVYALVVQPDGKIVVGGYFTTLGGGTRNRIARLNADGTLDVAFSPGADDRVNSLAVQADGKILVGGSFSTLGGQPRDYLGRLNADGTLDVGFDPGADDWVYSLAVQADGKILVGGWFSTLGGQTRNCIARLNTDGTADSGFSPGANDEVDSLAVQADGKILVGGNFTTLGGQTRNYVGRLNADGVVDAGFDPGADGWVYSLAVQADGKILVGGSFSTLRGQPRLRIGRLYNSAPATQSLMYDGSTITWLRGGTSPEVWRAIFEASPNGTNWSSLGAGLRISGGWQLANITVTPGSTLRARGQVAGGYGNASAWFIETLLTVPGLPRPTICDCARLGNGCFQLHFIGQTGVVYTVEASFNLTGWTAIGVATETATPGTFEFTDPDAPNHQQCYYRLRLP